MFDVYLLDDDSIQLKMLKGCLDWEECEAQVVGYQIDYKVAFNEILDKKPDVVYVNIAMTTMDGFDFISKLRERKFRGSFVAISKYAEYEYVKRALKYNVVDYCLKPIDEDMVREALKRAIDVCRKSKILESFKIVELKHTENTSFPDILDYVNTHFMDEISLQSVAEHFFISPSYLSKVFKNGSNMTFTAYLSKVRLETACRLLCESSMQVIEIADRIGFKNYFYFARVFKKTYNVTPSNYRQFGQLELVNCN